ncbi:MAG TPA: nucleotide sugar dehydrogenase, partial [Epulopiscium sp.]|nr:nucleotide sugar dehydrogenase [Candidatus Epulonipiscium sp.]
EKDLKQAKFLIVTVPTPIHTDKRPDLSWVIEASRMVGRNLSRGSVVVYESTVYPGVTEEICMPILEEASGLRCGIDFKVGYSPERINPGDQINTLENITKIVSGMDQETLEFIAGIYEIIITAGVHRVSTIKVAEATKVVENSQRDINIAFMNELAMIFDRMDIDTKEVVEAMNTKWNALGFYPGLVGGHCIGIDPYYFIYQAEKLGYHSQIILSGRKINDGMAKFIGEAIIKQLVLANKVVKEAKVAILGLTFKENCLDIRNSKVEDIVRFLREYGIDPVLVDPVGNKEEIKSIYASELMDFDALSNMDCLVFAVGHDQFKDLPLSILEEKFIKGPNNKKIMIDVKGIYDKNIMEKAGYIYWRL